MSVGIIADCPFFKHRKLAAEEKQKSECGFLLSSIRQQHFFAFEIGFVWVCIGFVLAFYWLLLGLIGFDWVCIGFELGLFFPLQQVSFFS